MRTRFAFLSKFAAKFIEVAGAGLASALCGLFSRPDRKTDAASGNGRADVARERRARVDGAE